MHSIGDKFREHHFLDFFIGQSLSTDVFPSCNSRGQPSSPSVDWRLTDEHPWLQFQSLARDIRMSRSTEAPTRLSERARNAIPAWFLSIFPWSNTWPSSNQTFPIFPIFSIPYTLHLKNSIKHAWLQRNKKNAILYKMHIIYKNLQHLYFHKISCHEQVLIKHFFFTQN